MSRARPSALPVESPNWIGYDAALQEAIRHYGVAELAIAKLAQALASGKVRCKIERLHAEPVLVTGSDRAAAVHLPQELRWFSWEDNGPVVYLNDAPQDGWLFLWNDDLEKDFSKIFLGVSAVVETAPVKGQKTVAVKGRPPIYDWPEIAKNSSAKSAYGRPHQRGDTDMARPETAARTIERAAYTINEFCESHGFSRAHYYNLKAAGKAPEELNALGKILITREAAAKWRKRMMASNV